MKHVLALVALSLLASSASALPLTWIGGNVDWVDGGAAANWNPNDEPDSDDEAIFNTANSVNLGSNNSVNGLTMSGGIDLDTNEFDLTVDGTVTIGGASTNLILGGAAGSVQADDVIVNASVRIQLDGGALTLVEETGSGQILNNAGGTVFGHGSISLLDILGVTTTLFVNDGTISASRSPLVVFGVPDPGTLTITASDSNDARIDLDGAGEAGVVNVNRNQTLHVDVRNADAFSGTLNLSHNSTLNQAFAWTFGAGTINVDNGFVDSPFPTPDIPAGTATITGGLMTQSAGTIDVQDADGTLIFVAPFQMNAGTLINNGHVIFNSDATIANAATFTMGASGSDLTVGPNASVSITQASFNLDGNAPTTIITVEPNGLLTLDLGDYDNDAVANGFDGILTLNSGDISVNTADVEFVMDGTLNMNNLTGDAAGIASWASGSEPLDIGNDSGTLDANLNIGGAGTVHITSANIDFNSDADVNVAAGTRVDFLNPVNFNTVNGANNAEFTGAGTISFTDDVNVIEAVTLNMVGGTVDLDGSDGVGDTINVDAPFTIHVATMSIFGNVNGGGGTNILDINNSVGIGVLTVNLDDPNAEWTLNGPGVMNLVNDNAAATLLAGSDVNLNGTLNVTGDVRTTARLDIGSTAVVNINTLSEPLRLAGGNFVTFNTLGGAVINGAGMLAADNAKALQGTGTINTDVDFDGSAKLMADNGTLVLNGSIIDVGTIGTASAAGTLNVTNTWNTAVADNVTNFGGLISGGTITVTNPTGINGGGSVTARVINNSRLVGSLFQGTHTFQTALNDNDWDGAGGTGALHANNNSTLELRDVGAAFGFTGTVEATSGSRVFTNGFALDFNPGSSINLTNGTYESTNSTNIGGTVTVNAGGDSTIEVEFNRFLIFEPTSVTTLNGNLRLVNNNNIIETGATFSGAGALIVPDGSHALMDPNANANVLLINDGAFRPNGFDTVGRVDVKDYQQGVTGTLIAELTGTALNQYDRLVVNGAAVLDGNVEVELDGGFVPVLGNEFNILSASGGLTGAVAIDQPNNLPPGLFFNARFEPTILQLVVTDSLPGDYNRDNIVDAADYLVWRKLFGAVVADFTSADGNGDGIINDDDYGVWERHFGTVPPPGSGAGASVPEPTSILLFSVALAAFAGGRRRQPSG